MTVRCSISSRPEKVNKEKKRKRSIGVHEVYWWSLSLSKLARISIALTFILTRHPQLLRDFRDKKLLWSFFFRANVFLKKYSFLRLIWPEVRRRRNLHNSQNRIFLERYKSFFLKKTEKPKDVARTSGREELSKRADGNLEIERKIQQKNKRSRGAGSFTAKHVKKKG